MHIIHDENGNPIAHGHDHEHAHTHEHGHDMTTIMAAHPITAAAAMTAEIRQRRCLITCSSTMSIMQLSSTR